MKKEVLIILGILFFIIVFTVGKYSYEYYKYERNVSIEESEKRKIDEYNFEQGEKVKDVLRWKFKSSYNFDTLAEFNKQFSQNIKPIKNCYFLGERNGYFEEGKGGGGYIFGFELYSDKYIEKYGKQDEYETYYYAYPKYDLPYDRVCFGVGKGSCYDLNQSLFNDTITKPCK